MPCLGAGGETTELDLEGGGDHLRHLGDRIHARIGPTSRLPIFDGNGYPVHRRGVTAVDGVYVLGLPWLWTWGSGRFLSVGRDAEHVVGHLAARHSAQTSSLKQSVSA